MYLKPLVLTLIFAACSLGLLGCGGTPLTPEEALIERAESYDLSFSSEDWLEAHEYLSPRTREVCKNADFAVVMGMGMSMLKDWMGISEDEKITFSVLRVTVDGDIGRIYTEAKYEDKVLEFGEDEGQGAVYVDGEWWVEEDDWENTCQL